MRPILVDRKVLHRGGVAREVTEGAQGERIPHDDLAFFSAGGDKAVSVGVNE